MLKIGIADYYLDNWHANYYPGFLREAAKKFGFDADIVSAFAFCERQNGVSSDQWCAERNIRRAASMAQMLEEVDAVMVIAADNSAWHPMVCEAPLASGKPVFVDKTFAPDVRTGREMFQRAAEHGTPVFYTGHGLGENTMLSYAPRPMRMMFVRSCEWAATGDVVRTASFDGEARLP